MDMDNTNKFVFFSQFNNEIITVDNPDNGCSTPYLVKKMNYTEI